METIDLTSWSEYRDTIAKIRERYGTHSDNGPNGPVNRKNDILFRGQSDSSWELKTTLERISEKRFSIAAYIERANSVKNEIETITGKGWNLPDFLTILNSMKDGLWMFTPDLPFYEYMVYLRHFSFPSPLLDWTSSPYIAAYFALEQRIKADRATVFVFIERPDGVKSGAVGRPMITHLGPYATTHFRHFAQKASYTIATEWDHVGKSHYFCDHQAVSPLGNQDILIKLTIPRIDRVNALRELDELNTIRYTLFQSDDALIQSLGTRAFELDIL